MRNETIKVGAKSKSSRPQMKLRVSRPENVADCLTLCEGNEVAVATLFNRGYTIWLQDRFGRPMFESGDSADAIQSAFTTAVPGKTKGVSQRKAQPEVTISKGKRYTPDEIAALIAKAGGKVTFAE